MTCVFLAPGVYLAPLVAERASLCDFTQFASGGGIRGKGLTTARGCDRLLVALTNGDSNASQHAIGNHAAGRTAAIPVAPPSPLPCRAPDLLRHTNARRPQHRQPQRRVDTGLSQPVRPQTRPLLGIWNADRRLPPVGGMALLPEPSELRNCTTTPLRPGSSRGHRPGRLLHHARESGESRRVEIPPACQGLFREARSTRQNRTTERAAASRELARL